MKYLVCRNGNRITVKRPDRNNDFGEVLGQADTLPAARELAHACRRLSQRPVKPADDLFSNGEAYVRPGGDE